MQMLNRSETQALVLSRHVALVCLIESSWRVTVAEHWASSVSALVSNVCLRMTKWPLLVPAASHERSNVAL